MAEDIIYLLSEGDKRTVTNVDSVVAAVLKDAQRIEELMNCLVLNDEVILMHAMDAVEKVYSVQPTIIRPYSDILFELFVRSDQKEVRWHMAQILPSLLQKETQISQAVSIWSDDFNNSKSSIVRTFSLQALFDVDQKYENLGIPLDKYLNHALEHGTPALRSRVKKLIRYR